MSTPIFFNTAGPVNPEWHYCIPALSRLDLDGLLLLIEQQKYFVLHAPRQTGKTTCLNALVKYLNAQGKYRASYINVEVGQACRDDTEKAFLAINRALVLSGRGVEPRLASLYKEHASEWGAVGAFSELLGSWTKLDPRPLVLVIDEVDALVGDTLITLLRNLRAGYNDRPHSFPSSVILCGLRDVRDYRLFSSVDKTVITGGSAFNIKAESLRLGDFDRQQVEMLLGQHTQATGQAFTPEAIDALWNYSQGQPWLVNALAYQACFADKEGKDRSRSIDLERIDASKEMLIQRRDTHIDQLADKLQEDRVRRVIQPMLLAEEEQEPFVDQDDLQYCIDLGLIRLTNRGPAIANPIYREVVPRELISDAQEFLKARFAPDWVRIDGSLDMPKLLDQFQEFYSENGEAWANRFAYQEAGPQLLLQAFLQRVINGQGRIEREYALGTGRTDLYLRWPFGSGIQKAVIELKVLRKSLDRTIAEGMTQVAAYAERCGATEIHLLIFTKDRKISATERVFRREAPFQGRSITIWGM